MAEIKVMYKKVDPNDKEKMAEKEAEISKLKTQMQRLKDEKINEAKEVMEQKQQSIQKEKDHFLKNIKGSLKPGIMDG